MRKTGGLLDDDLRGLDFTLVQMQVQTALTA
jgi:hypothetical protein